MHNTKAKLKGRETLTDRVLRSLKKCVGPSALGRRHTPGSHPRGDLASVQEATTRTSIPTLPGSRCGGSGAGFHTSAVFHRGVSRSYSNLSPSMAWVIEHVNFIPMNMLFSKKHSLIKMDNSF
ncbi:hypothetical protein, unlikely [Trypanosoma congolense IL3000]|uniref:Uncharacterized protein n=1 Tax=Trypanosoma congolense (strain IL3000) TaxID=1068625 RepID=F9WAW4_TRYCI|nr:hypothetical protein, unlikely [Trypanosoma congolense IL3000]